MQTWLKCGRLMNVSLYTFLLYKRCYRLLSAWRNETWLNKKIPVESRSSSNAGSQRCVWWSRLSAPPWMTQWLRPLAVLAKCRDKTANSWLQTFAVLWMLYSYFWVIPPSLNFVCRRFETLCSIFIGGVLTSPMKMEQSVPKRRHIKFIRRRITQK